MSTIEYIPPTIRQHVTGFFEKQPLGPEQTIQDRIDGVPVSRLTEEFGSPLFVYSEATIRRLIRDAKRAFTSRYPKTQFAWSYKTNYLRSICQVFHEEGSIAEVVSDFEYEKARNLGIRGENIIYNGPAKTPDSLRRAVDEGAKIQIDNFSEIENLERLLTASDPIVEVGIRVQIQTGSGHDWTKFGFALENGTALRAIRRIHASGRMRVVGLHCHLGTFLLNPEGYRTSIQKLLGLARQMRDEFGGELKYLNAGGGFASKSTLHHQYLPGREAAPSFDQYADVICGALLEELRPDEPQPTLYLESGRSLIDEAGYLISSVLDSRHGPNGGREILIDAGVNLLYTAAWYRYDITPAQPARTPAEPTRVYGPLCMNIDEVRRDAPLPRLTSGDQVVLHPVGAYNLTQSMQFIMYRPAVVLIGMNGEVDVIRHRETLDHVEALEELPYRMSADQRSMPPAEQPSGCPGASG